MANPTIDWERVADRFYRKVKLYEAVFDPELELENHLIAGAPYAGALGEHVEEQPCSDANLPSTISRRKQITRIPKFKIYQIRDRRVQLLWQSNSKDQCKNDVSNNVSLLIF